MPQSATPKRRAKARTRRRQPVERVGPLSLQRLTGQQLHVNMATLERYVPGYGATIANARRWGKTITLAIALLFLLGQAVYYAPLGIVGPTGIGLDNSWLLALPYQLQHGQISGRDFYFTYGILAQVISVLGTLPVHGGSIIDAAGMIFLVNMLATVALVGVILALARLVNAWQVLLVAAVFMVLNIAPGVVTIRELTTVACAISLGCVLAAPSASRRLLLAGIMGLVCFAAQLMSAELAPFTIGGSVLVLVLYTVLATGKSLLSRADLLRGREYLTMLGVLLVTFLSSNLAIDVIFKLTAPTYTRLFDYQLQSLDVIRGYNQTLGVLWGLSNNLTIALVLMVMFTAALVIALIPRIPLRDQYTLVCLLVFALLQLKGAIVRSDTGHILANTIPLVFLFLVLSKYCVPRNTVSALLTIPWLMLFIALFNIWQVSDYSALTNPGRWIDKFSVAPKKLAQLVSVRSAPNTYLPTGLAALPAHGPPMVDFPYDNYIAMGLKRPLVAPVLQAYAAETSSLQRLYTSHLSQLHNFEVVYGIDGIAVAEVDGVQNMTRVPLIFEYLYRHFELESRRRFGTGYYLLHRRPHPRTLPVSNVPFSVQYVTPAALVLHVSPTTACSLVQVSLRISYPFTAVLGRPDSLNVQFLYQGHLFLLSNLVPVEVGKVFTTYVSLMKPAQFHTLFETGAAQTMRWDTLQIGTNDTGLFGVQPSGVDVTHLGCVRPSA
jgi:hypothetical protein